MGRGARTAAKDRLRRIKSVTDVALTNLDVQDLLAELLTRVRDVLDVDTAAVLLIDQASGDLVATAASGLEEEVRPIVLEDVDHADIYNPILRDKGVRSLLGTPLVIEGRVIGVIHVGSLSTRRFDSEDVDLLQMVASQVALAVEARRS